MPIGLKIFMDKICVINLHLTKITKLIDLENLELYSIFFGECKQGKSCSAKFIAVVCRGGRDSESETLR